VRSNAETGWPGCPNADSLIRLVGSVLGDIPRRVQVSHRRSLSETFMALLPPIDDTEHVAAIAPATDIENHSKVTTSGAYLVTSSDPVPLTRHGVAAG
jgi:hypothetical protein